MEEDDFITLEIYNELPSVKLFDPQGNTYPYKCDCDGGEGFNMIYLFEILNPIPGKWKMVMTSKKLLGLTHCCVLTNAYSNKEGAYKN